MSETEDIQNSESTTPLTNRLSATLDEIKYCQSDYLAKPDQSPPDKLVEGLTNDPQVLVNFLELTGLDSASIFANCPRTIKVNNKIASASKDRAGEATITRTMEALQAELPDIFKSSDTQDTAKAYNTVLETAKTAPQKIETIKDFPDTKQPNVADLQAELSQTIKELKQVIRYASTQPDSSPKSKFLKIFSSNHKEKSTITPEVLQRARANLLLLNEVRDKLADQQINAKSTEQISDMHKTPEEGIQLGPESQRYPVQTIANSLNRLTPEKVIKETDSQLTLIVVEKAEGLALAHKINFALKANGIEPFKEDPITLLGVQLPEPTATSDILPDEIQNLPPEAKKQAIIDRITTTVTAPRMGRNEKYKPPGTFTEFVGDQNPDTVPSMIKALTLASSLNQNEAANIATKAMFAGFLGVYSDGAQAENELQIKANPYGRLYNATTEFVRRQTVLKQAEAKIPDEDGAKKNQALELYDQALGAKKLAAKSLANAISEIPNKEFRFYRTDDLTPASKKETKPDLASI